MSDFGKCAVTSVEEQLMQLEYPDSKEVL
jgi:hypothetical protein